MVLNIICLLLILGITFLNTIYGLFSGLVNLFCSIIALVIALGFFETATDVVTEQFGFSTTYAPPICLAALYAVSLTILRTAADNLVRGNVRVPASVDWVGGGICGFLIAEISVGVLVLSFMLLPFGGQAAMYQRYQRTDDFEDNYAVFEKQPVWLMPDEFAAGLFKMLSSGSLQSKTTFASVYPNFADWVFYTGNTVQDESSTAPQRGKSRDGFERGISVDKWWRADEVKGRYVLDKPTRQKPEPPYKPLTYKPEPGYKLIGVRIGLDSSSAESPKSPMHRFRPTMIRLVGTVDGKPMDAVARVLGGVDPNIGDAYRIADIDSNFTISGGGTTNIDAFFEVDERFEPSFVEYRRFARAGLRAGSKAEDGAPTERLAATQGDTKSSGGGSRSTGPLSFARGAIKGSYGDFAQLTDRFGAPQLVNDNAEISGDKFVSGRFSGAVSDLKARPGQPEIRDMAAPGDRRIFRITIKPKQAQTLAGGVFNFVSGTLSQFRVLDKTGDSYPLAGYSVQIQRDGEDYVEMFFTPDPEGTGFRGMLDFKDVKLSEIRGQEDALLTLYFLVPPRSTLYEIQNQAGQGVAFSEVTVGG